MSSNVKVIMPPAYVGLIKAWKKSADEILDDATQSYYRGISDALQDVINLIEMRGSN